MKWILKIAKGALIVLLVCDLLIWLAGYGSGHNLPLRTDLAFGFIGLSLLIAIVVASKALNKK